jgi:excisionase family DNA binding protein
LTAPPRTPGADEGPTKPERAALSTTAVVSEPDPMAGAHPMALDQRVRARRDGAAEPIELRTTLAADALEEIAQRAAAIVLAELGTALRSPYLTVVEAAGYLRCSRQRIDDLLSQGRLTRRKDGARTLVERAELDTYLGASSGREGDAPAMPPLRRACSHADSGADVRTAD